ncbi:hypothetical protein I4U23_013437 [Adineta vaga]|nr:hypothetical protein I4U23_013437 [Adineta vaga]
MSQLNQVLLLLLLRFVFITSTKTYNITSCVPNTSCQCYLTQYSLALSNCSHKLFDLPLFASQNANNVTRIVAQNAFTQWPSHICEYSNIQILDLSGSYLDSESVDFSCLTQIIQLNLSNTHLTKLPRFQNKYLQMLDLSNNNIKSIDGNDFQPLTSLLSLFLQDNPIQSIDHFDSLLQMQYIQSINLISSYENVVLKQMLTVQQWIQLVNQWKNSTKSFRIRMKNIPFQSIIPNPSQFRMISLESMTTIMKMFVNSTFITVLNTPYCNCNHLREYQRFITYVIYSKKYTSSLFQFTKCLMPDGTTHARLFDRFTYIDLQCPKFGKISFFPLMSSSSSTLTHSFISFFLFCLFLLY